MREVCSLRMFKNKMPVVIWSKVDEETGRNTVVYISAKEVR